MTLVSLTLGKKFIAKNDEKHRILIIENLGKANCTIKSSRSDKDFKGYKLTQYSDKEFAVEAGEKLEIMSDADTTIRITGTDY